MEIVEYCVYGDPVYGNDKFGRVDDCPVHLHREKPTYVLRSHFDRIQAERDALQLRLNEVEGENDRLMALLHPDRLSNIIREVDGSHSLGAGALAERIIAKMEKQS